MARKPSTTQVRTVTAGGTIIDPELRDISPETPVATEEQRHLLRRISEDRDMSPREETYNGKHPVQIYREYVKGNQRLTLTAKQKKFLEGLIGNKYCDNICHQIVQLASARLKFLRWEGSDKVDPEEQLKAVDQKATTVSMGGIPPDPVAIEEEKKQIRLQSETEAEKTTHKFLADLYIRQKVRYKSGKMGYDKCRDGSTFMAVGVENESTPKKFKIRLYREQAWNGDRGVFVKYDEDDEEKIEYAVKEWPVKLDGGRTIRRRTIWVEGELQRWVSMSGSGGSHENWTPYQLKDDKSWPVAHVDPKTGDPLPIPIVHFPNTGRDQGIEGFSELAGGIVGGQDQINDLAMIMCATSRLTGGPMYTASGIQNVKKVSPDGTRTESPPEMEVGPGQVWTSTDPNTRFGVLPPGDISQLIMKYDHQLGRLAEVTMTPKHLITGGDWPSGEALLRAEQPAVSKAETQIETDEVKWAEVGYLAVRMYNAFGPGGLDEEVIISAVMDEPTRADLLSKVAIAKALEAFISTQEALRICDYSEDRIQAIMDEKAATANAAVDSAMKVFGAGVAPGQEQGIPKPPTPPSAKVPATASSNGAKK
jgi:hypothetical protein